MFTYKRNKLFTLAGALLATGLFAQTAVAMSDAKSGFVYFTGERGLDYVHSATGGTTPAGAADTIGADTGFRYVGGERGWAYLPTHAGPAGAQAPRADLFADGKASGHYVGGELGWVNGPVNPAFEARIRQHQDDSVLARE